jgi:hypothetical protein
MIAALSEEFRRRWEADRERREVAELEELARWLIGLFGSAASQGSGSRPPS